MTPVRGQLVAREGEIVGQKGHCDIRARDHSTYAGLAA